MAKAKRKKNDDVQLRLRLGQEQLEVVHALAKLSGESEEGVVRVVLAMGFVAAARARAAARK